MTKVLLKVTTLAQPSVFLQFCANLYLKLLAKIKWSKPLA